jgi:hypothetical protein
MGLKPLSPKELEFCRLLKEGVGVISAARLGLKWKCEPGTKQYQKARDLAHQKRIKEEVERLRQAETDVTHATSIISSSNKLDLANLRQFAYDRLTIMRDDVDVPAKSRFMAIQALERLNDPSKDVNLIYRWIDVMWRYFYGHCPACHRDFPLWQVKNERLDSYRTKHNIPPDEQIVDRKQARLGLIKESERLRHPHPGQVRAIEAEERHIVGTGAARAGKSFTLAMFLLMYLMIPGVEIWLLARVYDDAEPEFNYLDGFLKTLLHPMAKHMVTVNMDRKTGEAYVSTRWGSVARIKSGKAQGSITGRELEFAGVAEPAWVDGKLYEELRARMTSRMGRIVALGTPKGFGGFIHRMIKQTSRNTQGKLRTPEERLIENGCPWSQSLYLFNYDPTENPSYVKSEREAARSELTKEEYASEFEGIMMAEEGMRFPTLPMRPTPVTRGQYEHCQWVLGIDQGPKNFGACLIGYDGHKLYVSWDFFDNDENTSIKANLIKLNYSIPPVIFNKGGNADNWCLTIFDIDPPCYAELDEMKRENKQWKTEETYRPKNQKDLTNWREETMEWIKGMGKAGKIVFDEECDLLLDELREARIRPRPEGKDLTPGNEKGWIVSKMGRQDHVMDAFLFACYCIMNGMLSISLVADAKYGTFEAANLNQEFERIQSEKEELQGFEGYNGKNYNPQADAWRSVYGRELPREKFVDLGSPGYYDGES